MTIEAAAEALAPETAAPIETPELSEDAALDAAFDRMQAEEPKKTPDPEDIATEEGEAEGDEGEKTDDPEKTEVAAEAIPSIIPGAVRDHWASIPKEARDAIAASQQEMSSKLAEGQRLVHGLTPIRDVMITAARENPALADMKPDQIASEMLELSRVSRNFSEKPVETMMGLIQKHNIGAAMQKALSGQEITAQDSHVPDLMKTIEGLHAKIERMADPEYMRSQFTAVASEERAFESVSKFAKTADNWAELEPHIPSIIPIIRGKLGESASAEDVLSEAYKVARTIYLPEPKAPAKATDEVAEAADPKRTEAALKARSVNIASKPTGKVKEPTEDDLLDQAYERARSR